MKYNGLILAVLLLFSCHRGKPSPLPPVHLVRDMDSQPKYKAQSPSDFFKNHATMQEPVAGALAQIDSSRDQVYGRVMAQLGLPINNSSLTSGAKDMQQGHERFTIYCSPCHGSAGNGQGLVVKAGFVPPPAFQSDRLRKIEDGYIFQVISDGIRNMPAHKQQIPVHDRWLITHYLRTLQ